MPGLGYVSEIHKDDGEAVFVRMNTLKVEDIQKGLRQITEKFGTIDILYNGAGIRQL